MKELSGALIGTTAVIWAVFLPMSFFEGSVGVIYRQFSVTISVAMAISLFIALTLSPSLCGVILKSRKAKKDKGVFASFNHGFEALRRGHKNMLDVLLENRFVLPALFLVLIIIAVLTFLRIPTSFLPDEDQGRMFTLLNGRPVLHLNKQSKKLRL